MQPPPLWRICARCMFGGLIKEKSAILLTSLNITEDESAWLPMLKAENASDSFDTSYHREGLYSLGSSK